MVVVVFLGLFFLLGMSLCMSHEFGTSESAIRFPEKRIQLCIV